MHGKCISNRKLKFILCIGCSSSGKSTYAEAICGGEGGFIELNRDRIRFDHFTCGERSWQRYKFNKKNERFVTEQEEALASKATQNGLNIISSNTNLNPSIRQKWKDFAEEHGYEYEEKLFPCDWNTLVKRNAQREGGLPESLLWSQYKRYMQQFGKIGGQKLDMYRENLMLENTIIADLDGTLASFDGVRNPYDWHLVSKDLPRIEIIRMLEGLAYVHGHVTFMSGRDGVCYEDTYQWLVDHVTSEWPEWIEWQLVMRTPDDKRKDDIVKYELFNKHIRGKFNVAAALDDRYSVVRLWSLLGIPNIIQVGEYNNEF